jgi:hypothetical protein
MREKVFGDLFAALPPDVRKGFAFPEQIATYTRAMPEIFRA